MARRRLFCWLLYLCRLDLALADLFIEVTRFRLRVNAQFLAEDLFAGLILFQRRAVLPGPQIYLHQLAMRRLIQRVERDQPPRIRNGLVCLTQRAMIIREYYQGHREFLAQILRCGKGPFVEVWSVLKAEPGRSEERRVGTGEGF